MRPILQQRVPVERLTREPKHWFFGYYDVQPFSKDLRYHLCHETDFMNRMPGPWDTARLGVIRLRDGQFQPFDETQAWNWQQGSMLQWNPAAPDDEVLYNTLADQGYRCAVRNVHTGEYRLLPRPLATVDPSGRWGLSVNFSRIYGFRRGYGYAQFPDPFVGLSAPAEDGVFLMDMRTGENRLVLSLKDMVDLARPCFLNPAEENSWVYLVNHITFNPDGSRFVALLRGRPNAPRSPWRTYTITANRDGSEPYLLLDDVASHYHWRDPAHILFYAKTYRVHEWGLWLFRDRSHEALRVDEKLTMPTDGHCNYSPDRRYILNDTYPMDGYRSLFLYDIEKDQTILLGRFKSVFQMQMADGDMRCDLHPRWSPDGSMISFDSIHEGHRHVYRIYMDDIPLS